MFPRVLPLSPSVAPRDLAAWLVLALLFLAGCGGDPATGTLRLEVVPEESKVFLEGVYQGTGDVQMADLEAPFTYFLKAVPPPGWHSREERVELEPGETRILRWTLESVVERRARREAAQVEESREGAVDRGELLPRVKLVTTMGSFTVELFEDDAPNTVASFVALADHGLYQGTLFHRVIDGFMIQGGDPLSKDQDPSNDGTGGPGYRIRDEFSSRKHEEEGILSMANSGPNTGGSQFFVTLGPTPHLDGRHTVFGRVVEGMGVVRTIGETPIGAANRPQEDVRIVEAEVLSRRDHEYHPVGLDGRPVELP